MLGADWAREWDRCYWDALKFVTVFLRANPEPWQTEALQTISHHDRLSIRAGHGVGKTTLLAWIVLWFMFTRYPFKIPITANSQDQLRDVVWPELRKWAGELPEAMRAQLEIGADRIALKGAEASAFATARTASSDNPEALQGFHEENLLFIVEEASGIPDIVFDIAQGSLSTPGAKIVMLANPTRNSGYFRDSHTINRDRWKTMRVNSEDVPRARGHIAEIIARYGRDSNAYRVRVLGEFPDTEDDILIPLHLVEAAIERELGRAPIVFPVWGVDVARFGDDRSSLAKRQGNRLLEPVKSWRGLDTMQLVGKIIQEWKDTDEEQRPSEILVDVIGIGSGVVDRVAELGLPARGVNVGESAAISDLYTRLRDELWFKARQWLEDRSSSIPKDESLIAELTSVKVLPPTSAGKNQIERKQDTKKRLQRSPDLADAFILTFAGGLDRMPEPEMDRYAKAMRRPRAGSWMAVAIPLSIGVWMAYNTLCPSLLN